METMKILTNDPEAAAILRRIENVVDLDRNQIARFFQKECGKYTEIHLDACLSEILDPVKFGSELIDMKTKAIKPHTSQPDIVISAILQYEIVREAAARFQKRFQQERG